MTKEPSHSGGHDSVTGRGTVKGRHANPGEDVTEGGPAPSPKENHGSPKESMSNAKDGRVVGGDDTSRATSGHREQEHAAERGAAKTQSGRGHRKHDD